MESDISTRKVIEDFEGITLAKNTVIRKRKTSLFDPTERPKMRDEDRGVAVMTHADYPLRSRSRSLPADPDKVKIPSGFVKENVGSVIQNVLETKLKGKRYDPKECSALTRQLVNTLREKVSALEMKNYKFVCTCYITKKMKPPPSMQSGCAWDESAVGVEKDGFAEYIYKSDELIAVATVYGIYGERRSDREKYIKKIKGFVHAPIPE